MKVRYRSTALAQIDAIIAFASDRNPAAAGRVLRTIKNSIDRLAEFPYSAQSSEVPGIRELPIVRYPYIVCYTVDEAAQEVHVLRVRHTSQDPEHHLD
ncbi:MAG: type II toxin-antitoxin system RelE/ParE family toxin [Hyphomicrobium sp.]